MIVDLLLEAGCGFLQGGGVSQGQRFRPLIERLHFVFAFQRHIQRVIAEPALVALSKSFQPGSQPPGAMTEGKRKNLRPAQVLRVIIHGIRITRKKTFTKVQCPAGQQSFPMQILQIDKIRIARKGAERLIRRVAETRRRNRQNLPVGLPALPKPIDKFSRALPERSDAEPSGQRRNRQQYAASSFHARHHTRVYPSWPLESKTKKKLNSQMTCAT